MIVPENIPIKRRKGRRRISLIVFPDNRIEVRAPMRAAKSEITRFLHQNSDWILKRINHNAKQPLARALDFTDGSMIPLFGDEIQLKFSDTSLKRGRSVYSQGVLNLKGGSFSQADVKRRVRAWYTQFATDHLTEKIEFYSLRVGRSPTLVHTRSMKSRWGSCSSTGRIALNWKIMAAPDFVINYLVVHELCHLVHPNHSERFWKKVESILPDFKTGKKWLRKNEGRILLMLD